MQLGGIFERGKPRWDRGEGIDSGACRLATTIFETVGSGIILPRWRCGGYRQRPQRRRVRNPAYPQPGKQQNKAMCCDIAGFAVDGEYPNVRGLPQPNAPGSAVGMPEGTADSSRDAVSGPGASKKEMEMNKREYHDIRDGLCVGLMVICFLIVWALAGG